MFQNLEQRGDQLPRGREATEVGGGEVLEEDVVAEHVGKVGPVAAANAEGDCGRSALGTASSVSKDRLDVDDSGRRSASSSPASARRMRHREICPRIYCFRNAAIVSATRPLFHELLSMGT